MGVLNEGLKVVCGYRETIIIVLKKQTSFNVLSVSSSETLYCSVLAILCPSFLYATRVSDGLLVFIIWQTGSQISVLSYVKYYVMQVLMVLFYQMALKQLQAQN